MTGMRYRLRSLLIVLALGPPGLAVAWMVVVGELVDPLLLAVAIYTGMVLMLLVAAWIIEAFWSRGRPAGHCSYCGLARRSLAEGAAGVLICRDCAVACIDLLDQELLKQQSLKQPTPADSSPKAH